MASRHQRRKAAQKRKEAFILGGLQADRAAKVAAIVRENRQHRPERTYSYGPDSTVKVANSASSAGNSKADWAYNPKDAARIAKKVY